MKVAITGKGGVGKTTLSSTLARLYADEGRTVLAADVDPDANLGLALGLTEEEVNAIVPVSKMKQLAKERTGANDQNSFYKLNPEVSDLPEKLAKDINGVKLLVMGTVDTGGTGCVCPEHVMLKAILSNLVFRKDDVVIMDMGEVFTALEQGVVDGQDNPLSTVRNEGWYEVQKYVYNTNHIIASLELFASNDFWGEMTEADQQAFATAAKEAAEYSWTLYMEGLASDIQFMQDSGLTVTDPSEEEHEKMKQAVEPVYDYLRSQYDWVDDVLELVNSVE